MDIEPLDELEKIAIFNRICVLRSKLSPREKRVRINNHHLGQSLSTILGTLLMTINFPGVKEFIWSIDDAIIQKYRQLSTRSFTALLTEWDIDSVPADIVEEILRFTCVNDPFYKETKNKEETDGNDEIDENDIIIAKTDELLGNV